MQTKSGTALPIAFCATALLAVTAVLALSAPSRGAESDGATAACNRATGAMAPVRYSAEPAYVGPVTGDPEKDTFGYVVTR